MKTKTPQMKRPKASEVRNLRLRVGISLPALAWIACVTLRTVQNWEAGTAPCHPRIWDSVKRELETMEMNRGRY